MNRLIFISAVCMQFGWISGVPHPSGVGAYAYQDSNGNRFAPFGGMPGFGNFASFGNSDNSAFASGVAAPGYTHQTAAISPDNPNMPNVDVTQRFSEIPGSGNYMSVSSSSFSSSTNNNGVPRNHRVAETLVNNNGKVTHYKVEN